MLTAAAASLGLVPIAREIFWGPMAYAMMGGIILGTLLTLLFLPALYVTWFRIKEPQECELPASHVSSTASTGELMAGIASTRESLIARAGSRERRSALTGRGQAQTAPARFDRNGRLTELRWFKKSLLPGIGACRAEQTVAPAGRHFLTRSKAPRLARAANKGRLKSARINLRTGLCFDWLRSLRILRVPESFAEAQHPGPSAVKGRQNSEGIKALFAHGALSRVSEN